MSDSKVYIQMYITKTSLYYKQLNEIELLMNQLVFYREFNFLIKED